MTIIVFDIEYRGPVPGKTLKVSTWNRVSKEAFRETGELHAKEFLPKHFRYSAYSEYGYAKRKKSYELRKARRKGHRRPLVWSGESERRSRMARVRSTKDKAMISVPAPALNFKPPHSQINMRAELSAVSQADVRAIINRRQRFISRSLRALTRRERKRIG